MADFGQTTALGSTTATVSFVRAQGGQLPATDNMVLDSISMYLNLAEDAANVRLGVYQGGALDAPEGATLLEDFGLVTGLAGGAQWYTLNSSTNPALSNGGILWAAFTGSGSGNAYFSSSSGDAGDWQSARGRHDGALPGSLSALPATYPAGGSFGSGWYSVYITYSIDAGGGSSIPVIMHHLRQQGIG